MLTGETLYKPMLGILLITFMYDAEPIICGDQLSVLHPCVKKNSFVVRLFVTT